MRTTTQDENSKYRVVLYFFMNGLTLSYFDKKEEIPRWVRAMEEKHGRITSKEITEVNTDK